MVVREKAGAAAITWKTGTWIFDQFVDLRQTWWPDIYEPDLQIPQYLYLDAEFIARVEKDQDWYFLFDPAETQIWQNLVYEVTFSSMWHKEQVKIMEAGNCEHW